MAPKLELLTAPLTAELLHGPQAERLNAHRSRTHQRQGVHAYRVQLGRLGRPGRSVLKKLRSDMLGLLLDLPLAVQHHQVALEIKQLAALAAQQRPVPSFDREAAAEVEQGALAEPVRVALALHESEGAIGLAGFSCSRLGASNEHGKQDTSAPRSCKSICTFKSLHFDFSKQSHNKSMG